MIEKYTLDNLNQDNVSVVRQTYIEYQGKEYPIGEPWRKAYVNSVRGREEVKAELPKTQVDAIFIVWGDTSTVEDVS